MLEKLKLEIKTHDGTTLFSINDPKIFDKDKALIFKLETKESRQEPIVDQKFLRITNNKSRLVLS